MNKGQPTSIDVAAMAGVSQTTVSRVLTGSALVSARAHRRVLEAAQTLNYKVDVHARKLRSKKITSLEVIVVEDTGKDYGIINPFFLPMIGEIVRYGREKGYEVAITFQRELDSRMRCTCGAKPAQGIIFLAPKNFETFAEIAHGSDDHWVIWGRSQPGPYTSGVVSDNEQGAFDAVQHLIAQGRRHIAYLGKLSGEQWEFTERQAGYGAALRAAGLAPDPGLQVDCALSLEGGAAAVEQLLGRGVVFDAIFAATDVLGVGAMQALQRRGMDVPGQVAVMGFDDLWICNTVTPRLSTIRQDTEAAARVLVDSVEALIEGGVASTIRIPTGLVIRDSCGASRVDTEPAG